MELVRYVTTEGDDSAAGRVRVGVRDGAVLRRVDVPGVAALLRTPTAGLVGALSRLAADGATETGPVRLLPPVDGLTEVWAAGVTYRRSSEARQEESSVADVYARVYEARRPELFLKSVAWRVVGPGEPIGVRDDSDVDVPEAELALVVDAAGRIVGATVCDDVSSRSIEGANPLYLPQAKIYAGACALGPGIVPVEELGGIDGLRSLRVDLEVRRGDAVAFAGTTSTAQITRGLEDLVEHLRRQQPFPDGVVLATGTGIVPDLSFTLAARDVVAVTVEGIGTLENPVTSASAFGWLTPDPARRPA